MFTLLAIVSAQARNLILTAALTAAMLAAAGFREQRLGEFEGASDVGDVRIPGSAAYDDASGTYRVTGSGANIWGGADAFHYIWRRTEGDLTLRAELSWEGEGQHAHRKGGWMVRSDLQEDSAYADVVVHGDGLIALQYRPVQGGPTLEVRSPIPAPVTLQLERHGHLFTLSVARPGDDFQTVGSVSVALEDPVYAGLAVCSHDPAAQETALFSNVAVEFLGVVPDEGRMLESSLEIVDIESGERRLVRRALEHFEAPNWSPDGKTLVYNLQGRLYALPVRGGSVSLLETGTAVNCNNDHGFSPDGRLMALSHSPQGKPSLIYVMPAAGGEPRLVTPEGPSYWHGWSPDGGTLAYCAERNGEYDVYTIPVEGGPEKRLTEAPGLDDGPDYSPDGRYIFFNSIRNGRMAIWRMNADGADPVLMTHDEEYADWFPHPSPDGKWLVFLSYHSDVEGHPPNKDVVLRIMPVNGGRPAVLATLFGGQGTINVPSWSPDSRQLAFVSYRRVGPAKEPVR